MQTGWLDHRRTPAEMRVTRAVWLCSNMLTPVLQDTTKCASLQCQVDLRSRSVSWDGKTIAWVLDSDVRWAPSGLSLIPETEREHIAAVVAASR